MDEDETKIRRNLVWLSSLIVAWWFVGIDLSVVAKKILGADRVEHPDRVWWVAALLLYYFLARFWNSEKAQGAIAQLKGLRRSVFQVRATTLLGEDVAKLSNAGGSQSLLISAKEFDRRFGEIDFGGTADSVEFRYYGFDQRRVWWRTGTVDIGFNRQGRDSANGDAMVNMIKIAYELPKWPHYWLQIKTVVKLLTWDHETTYVVVPLLLWLGAVAITMFNLAFA